MPEQIVDSAPIQFLAHIWKHMQAATGHSWLKVNHAMADALDLAIRSGMKFALDDFGEIAKRFRSGYWHHAENSYRTAVLYRNVSAYLALEKDLGRKPFIVKGASISTHTGDGPCGQGLARLIMGAQFTWNGECVTVTSFNDETGSFTVCSYTRTQSESCPKCRNLIKYSKDVLLHRFTLRHGDLRKPRKNKPADEPESEAVSA